MAYWAKRFGLKLTEMGLNDFGSLGFRLFKGIRVLNFNRLGLMGLGLWSI